MVPATWLRVEIGKSMTVVLAVAALAAAPGQTAKPGSATKPSPVGVKTHPACPAVDFQLGCASYAEVLKAKDRALSIHSTEGMATSVCFRPKEDSFFVLSVGEPIWWLPAVFDSASGKRIPDAAATSSGVGFVTEFIDGISTTSTMPITHFIGKWALPSNPTFSATSFDLRDVGAKEALMVTETQISADVIYPNRADKNITYRLRLQRSTGRFTETYTAEGSNDAFLERSGRCVTLAAFK